MVNYIAQIVIVIAIAAILAGSLNLVVGYGGVFSVVHAAFFGIGAYTTAQLALQWAIPFPLDLVASFLAAALVAALVGPPLARLSQEYIIVGTLAVQLVLFNVFLNAQALTGGSYGLFGVPRPTVPVLNLTALVDFAIFSVIIVALCYLLLWWLVHSPFGLALKGLREDPLLAQSFGKDVNRQRTIAFATGSGVAGIAGMLYARYVGYIDPHTFNIDQSLTTMTVLVVGGLGNVWGTLLSATILQTVPQVLRFIPASSNAVGHLQLLFFGLLLIILVRVRPQGLISERPVVRAFARRGRPVEPVGDSARVPASIRLAPATTAATPAASVEPPRALRVQGVSKAFGGLRAVDNLSLNIQPGHVTAIIGPNGAGKTTLFNLLTGYLHPDEGTITFGPHDLTRMRPFQIARLGISRSFQDVRVFSRMTVLENVVLAIQGNDAERLINVFTGRATRQQQQSRAQALTLLDNFGLLEQADELVSNLSYAQQKLLVVAGLAARHDTLILLDELAAGLDHDSVAQFSGLVRQIAREGSTVCLIEHNLEFVFQTADTVLVLDQGHQIAAGTPQEIQGDRRVAEIYFGQSMSHA